MVNLNHAIAASALLSQDLLSRKIDIMNISEPWVRFRKISNIPSSYQKLFLVGRPGAALLVHKKYPCVPLFLHRDIVAANIKIYDLNVVAISIYLSPSEDIDLNLSLLDSILIQYKDSPIVICGDFNAKSVAWGAKELNERGKRIHEFVTQHDLIIVNNSDSPPTYESSIGVSWIDLTLIKNINYANIGNWTVHSDITNSDHKLITFDLQNSITKISSRKRWRLDDLNVFDFRVDLSYLTNIFSQIVITKENIDDVLIDFNEALTRICYETRKNKKQKNHENAP